MTGKYQSFFTGQLIAIILFNCCFYFQGTISPSTLLGEFSPALTSLCQLSPTVLSPRPPLSLLRQPWDVSHPYILTSSYSHTLILIRCLPHTLLHNVGVWGSASLLHGALPGPVPSLRLSHAVGQNMPNVKGLS